MTELLSSAQMRALEAAAIASGAVTGADLMDSAGQGVVDAVMAEWPRFATGPHRAVVLCGPGNNGGDGFVVARLLAVRGWAVTVLFDGVTDRLPADARANLARWRAIGPFHPVPGGAETARLPACDLIVDALFGTGLTRAIAPKLEQLIPAPDLRPDPTRPRIVAVDVPSGLCADSGRMLEGRGFWADLTVTFHREKTGHHLAEGPYRCGRVHCVDIGLDGIPEVVELVGRAAMPGDRGIVRKAGPLQERFAHPGLGKGDPFGRPTHKYSHGHALIMAGGAGEGGAARLSARGALRIGAGLVTVACPLPALSENAARMDTVMLRPLMNGASLDRLLEDRRYNALCLGPGMGHDRARELVPVALSSGRRVVLDADALSAWAADPRDLFRQLHGGVILTPHGGEFARLFPDIAARLAAQPATGPAYSKVDATRAAALRAGCVVLFKGADTVIAAPDGHCRLNGAHYDRAAPWLATAGSGDVLSGFICGLLARGFEPIEAAQTATWLHVECARSFGPGLIAEDLPEQLPRVFRDLGL